MNEAGITAIKNALGAAEDNLYRARLAEKHNPGMVSGNGEPIQEWIVAYKKQANDLKEALAGLERP